ncbi:hypothetical protein M422DRAFT_157430, partial [Sphaerobolus stellatus SS14]
MLQGSAFFSSVPSDKESRFWVEYGRMAQQSDEEFLERYNGDLDVHLVFAGLFSAVSSAFIINMQSNLQPDQIAVTNALLTLLVEGSISNTSAGQNAVLPSSDGPTALEIASLALGYLSLSLSLLAAFGAVLGKQW